MKKTLLYIIALPLGVLLSSILPMIYSNILDHFIPFEFLSKLLKSYIIPVSSGSILTGTIIFIVPDYKKIFGCGSVFLTIILVFVFLEWSLYYVIYLLGQILALFLLIKDGYCEIDRQALNDDSVLNIFNEHKKEEISDEEVLKLLDDEIEKSE
jgi:hypothetical protein